MKKVLAIMLASCLVLGLVACGGSSNPTQGTTTAAPTTAPATTAAPTTPAPTTPAPTTPEPTTVPAPVTSDDPEENLTIGYWEHSFVAEGYGERYNFFRFYPEVPVLGKVFYGNFSNGGTVFAGTYEVKKESMDWAAYPDRDSKVNDKTDNKGNISKGTADYTVIFRDFTGKELGKLPYDGTILYNTFADGEPMAAQGATEIFYLHDASAEKSFYENELGVPFLSFVGDEDKTSTLQLNHDGSYTDLVFAMVEGKYVLAPGADGGLEVTLTPNDSTDTGAVLSIDKDYKTCSYKQDGGETVAMHNAADEAVEPSGEPGVEVYSTTAKVNLGVDVEFVLSFLDDGTATMSTSMGGTDLVIDADWEVDDAHLVQFSNVSNGEFTSKLASPYSITWKGDLSERAKGIEVVFEFPAQDLGKLVIDPAKVVKEEAKELYSTTAKVNIGIEVEFTLTFFSDKTAVMSASVMGNEMKIDSKWNLNSSHIIEFSDVSAGEYVSKLAATYSVTWTGDLSANAKGIEIVFEFPPQDLAKLQ